ncbi:MAG: T9SS type A sorting domain-containing protein [Ignavibacteriales bacterium]|nr:T9SS type A sorting domain-containing protein [Ignavibacteriales bacterium]
MKYFIALYFLAFTFMRFNAQVSSNFSVEMNKSISDSLLITIHYTETNYQLFKEIALQNDRLLFLRHQVLNNIGFPPILSQGKVATNWPSWREAQEHESKWAPYTDIFAYDIEWDSPPDETNDVAQTIIDLLAYLYETSQEYGHIIKLSTGLNYQFGTQHTEALAQSEQLHIHAIELLKIYPAKDPGGMDYVEWAVSRATEVRSINPQVQIFFGILTPDMTVNKSINVAEVLISEMKIREMEFDGFTLWSETDSIILFLEWLRGTTSIYTDEQEVNVFILEQNYPNPFNQITNIPIFLSKREYITLKVYNMLSQEVKTLVNRELNAGYNNIIFDASCLPSGIYFYRITNKLFSQTRKMLLLK